jgi:hypothetical protein
VVGWSNDCDLMADLCSRCHEAQHERLRACGVPMERPDNDLERNIQAWKGIGILHDSLAVASSRRVRELTEIVRILDQHCPEWRRVLRPK